MFSFDMNEGVTGTSLSDVKDYDGFDFSSSRRKASKQQMLLL
jgi:hypothetical protein